jgi:nitroreductase
MTSESVAELGVLEAIYSRRAVRAYQPRPVPEAEIRELLEAAVHAPTAMHREPWGFVVVQDRALLKKLSDRAKAMMVAAESASLAVGWGSSGRRRKMAAARHLEMLRDPSFNIFYDAPALVVICRREGGAFAEADCWLAAENLMLAAKAHGLGSCVIGFAVEVLNSSHGKRDLGIPEDGAAVAPVILGYPQVKPAPVARREPVVLKWIK